MSLPTGDSIVYHVTHIDNLSSINVQGLNKQYNTTDERLNTILKRATDYFNLDTPFNRKECIFAFPSPENQLLQKKIKENDDYIIIALNITEIPDIYYANFDFATIILKILEEEFTNQKVPEYIEFDKQRKELYSYCLDYWESVEKIESISMTQGEIIIPYDIPPHCIVGTKQNV